MKNGTTNQTKALQNAATDLGLDGARFTTRQLAEIAQTSEMIARFFVMKESHAGGHLACHVLARGFEVSVVRAFEVRS